MTLRELPCRINISGSLFPPPRFKVLSAIGAHSLHSCSNVTRIKTSYQILIAWIEWVFHWVSSGQNLKPLMLRYFTFRIAHCRVILVDKGHISQPTQMSFVKTGWLPLLQRLRWQNVQTGRSEKFLTKVVCHVLRSSDPTVALAGWWHNQWKCEKMLQISDHLDPPSDVTEDHFCYRYLC